MATGEKDWNCLIAALEELTENDVIGEVSIWGERLSVPKAITQQVDHYGYHVGQIALIARVLAKDKWQVLKIPRDKSREFNERKREG